MEIHSHTNKLEIYYASEEMAVFPAWDFENRIKCGHKIITTQVTLFSFLPTQTHTHITEAHWNIKHITSIFHTEYVVRECNLLKFMWYILCEWANGCVCAHCSGKLQAKQIYFMWICAILAKEWCVTLRHFIHSFCVFHSSCVSALGTSIGMHL